MNELENNNNLEGDLMPAKKPKKVEYSWIETAVQVRRKDLNFPALCAMFELTAEELQAILDKLPPLEDCNC
jgi:hypothetical protein